MSPPATTQLHPTTPLSYGLPSVEDGEKHGTHLAPGRAVVYPGYNAIDVHGPNPNQRRSRTRKLLVRAVHMLLLLAVFVMLFPTFLRQIVQVSRAVTGFYPGSALHELPHDCKRVADWVPVDHVPHHLDDLEHRPYHRAAETSLKLPISSDVLYFLARGSLSHGTIWVSADGEDKDNMDVTVTFLYDAEHLLDVAKVCLLQREDGHNGVGVFTPRWNHPHEHHRTTFFIDVHLPASSGSSVLQINKLETDLPLFMHVIGDIEKAVHFKSLALHTSNTPISSKSLSVDTAVAQTSNSHIFGNFTVHDTLELHTSNSPIVANVTMFHNGTSRATDLSMISSNGPVRANVSLIADTDDEAGGAFRVDAKTSNSPVELRVPTAPVDSQLNLRVHTANGPARVALHNTFEGRFRLQTGVWWATSVERADEHEADPAGKGRRRRVEFSSIRRGVTEGTARWVPAEERELGVVEVTTSNSPIALVL